MCMQSNVIILLCATVGTVQANMTNYNVLTTSIIIISASTGGIMVIVFIIILFLMVSTVIYFTLVKGIGFYAEETKCYVVMLISW